MYHVNLEREVLAVDAVLGGGVDVELSKTELVAAKGGGTVHYNLNGGVEVLKLNSLLRNVDDRLLSCECNGAVCIHVSGAE